MMFLIDLNWCSGFIMSKFYFRWHQRERDIERDIGSYVKFGEDFEMKFKSFVDSLMNLIWKDGSCFFLLLKLNPSQKQYI